MGTQLQATAQLALWQWRLLVERSAEQVAMTRLLNSDRWLDAGVAVELGQSGCLERNDFLAALNFPNCPPFSAEQLARETNAHIDFCRYPHYEADGTTRVSGDGPDELRSPGQHMADAARALMRG